MPFSISGLLAPAARDLTAAEALRDPDGDDGDQHQKQGDHVDDGEFVGALHGVEDPDGDGLGAGARGEEGDDHLVK